MSAVPEVDIRRRILAVDPGTTRSAFVLVCDGQVMRHETLPNDVVLEMLRGAGQLNGNGLLAVEMIASYGMPVGREVFETCLWIGRYIEAWSSRGGKYELIYRQDVKLALCGSARAKDANVRQALIDRFGGAAAIGKKKAPGPLYGIHGDEWSALAVAVRAGVRG